MKATARVERGVLAIGTRPRLALVAFLATALASATCFVASAPALVHPLLSSFDGAGSTPGSFSGATGAGGEIYVSDSSGSGQVDASGPPPPPAAPEIVSQAVSDLAYSDATVSAQINPHSASTTYHVDYGTDASYGSATPESNPIGSDEDSHTASAYLSGLQPGTTYHFRFVATNSLGTTDGPDATFTTDQRPAAQSCPNDAFRVGPSAALPDCRAYEQVSPVDKNGYDINSNASSLATPSGDAVTFGSLGAFAGAPAGGVDGYFARRGPGGWQTFSTTPPYDPTSNLYTSGPIGVSADFDKQLVFTNAKLTPDAIQGTGNLYIHQTSSDSYQLVATGGDLNKISATRLVGAADNFSHVVFQTSEPLASTPTPADTTDSNVYDFSGGQLHLVGVLPGGAPDPNGSDGAGGGFPPSAPAVSTDGTRVYWQDNATGALYLYQAGQSTLVSARQSDGSAQPGFLRSASPDGSRAYFTSDGRLTADASPAGTDLYRYDAETGQLSDLTPSANPDGAQAGVVSGQADGPLGEFVYFLANGQLAPGAPANNASKFYVWHDGQLRFIASVDIGQVGSVDDASRVSGDGSHFAFLARATEGVVLAGIDTHGLSELYVYDYPHDSLACASCLSDGRTPIGSADFGPRNGPDVFGQRSQFLTDSGRVFFESPDPLVSTDTNGASGCPEPFGGFTRPCVDVYEWEPNGVGSCRSVAAQGGCVSLISNGHSDAASFLASMSSDGKDVFFYTRESLVGQDQDSLYDLYDARVDGGIASQNPAPPPPPCSGGGCKPPPASPPAEPSPASSSISGPGNHGKRLGGKRRCRKGKKGRRCRKARRHAGTTRRTGR